MSDDEDLRTVAAHRAEDLRTVAAHRAEDLEALAADRAEDLETVATRRAEDLVATAAALAAEVTHLSETVTHLSDELATERARSGRHRLVLRLTVAGLVLDVALSVLIGAGFLRQDATTRQLAAIIAEQESTRSEALCPLFSIFLGAYDPASRAEGPARETYEDAYSTIRHVHKDVLHCTDPIVPGRTTPPKPTALGPLGFLSPPTPVVAAVVRESAAPTPRLATTRQTVRAPRKSSGKSKSGGKSSSKSQVSGKSSTRKSGGGLLGSVTRVVPKVTKALPKAKAKAEVTVGPLKAKLHLDIP